MTADSFADKLGGLSKPNDKVHIPDNVAASTLLIYSYLSWEQRDSVDTFGALMSAYETYLIDRPKGGDQRLASCYGVCEAARAFLTSMPGLNEKNWVDWAAHGCIMACTCHKECF